MLRSEFVEASATLLLINALASVLGPILGAAITVRFGMPALFFYTAAVHIVMMVFTILRTTSAPVEHGRERYIPVPQLTSPTALELDPRGPAHVDARQAA
jgi:hypothetical protein